MVSRREKDMGDCQKEAGAVARASGEGGCGRTALKEPVKKRCESERPEWCTVGSPFVWKAKPLTGCDIAIEEIIGYTDDGFLHTAHNYPVYETKFSNLEGGRVVHR